jgi:hypothetical protein
MQNSEYATDFNRLMAHCREHNIGVQTIKAIARGFWGKKRHSHVTWYEPVTDQDAIKKLVYWVLGRTDLFLITVGDIQELPKVLEAVASFESAPSDEEMARVVKKEGLEPVFT